MTVLLYSIINHNLSPFTNFPQPFLFHPHQIIPEEPSTEDLDPTMIPNVSVPALTEHFSI